MLVDPALVALGLSAVASLARQVDAYSRGQMTDDEVVLYHARVMAFMRTIEDEAKKEAKPAGGVKFLRESEKSFMPATSENRQRAILQQCSTMSDEDIMRYYPAP